MKKPLITVIIPVYNIEGYLTTCLNSVCSQTYENLEILLIDDGSIDRTGLICDEFAHRDPRVRVIHKKNEGQSVARNIGIANAKGEYVSFVDGDDWVTEDYLDKLFSLLQEYHADIANCNFIRKKKMGDTRLSDCSNQIQVYNPEQAIENLCYMKELNCAPISKLFKRHIFQDIQFPEGCIYEDLAIIYKTFAIAEKIVYCDFDGYFYMQRIGSSLKSAFNEKKLSRLYFSEEILNFVEEKFPRIMGAAYCRLFWSVSGALMDIPWNYKNIEVKERIRQNIYLCRKFVLQDKKCKKSVRILATLSYCGMVVYKFILDCYKVIRK